MRLDKPLYEEMTQHALEAFPEECCGFILYDPEADREIVRRIRNVATDRHQKDPANFPRDGRDGYIMDEKELDPRGGLVTARRAGASGAEEKRQLQVRGSAEHAD